jgi:superfamily II DNA or RNA helicase
MREPRPHPHQIQQQALKTLTQSRTEAKTKALTVLPSGIGKTHLAAFDTKKANAKRVLYIAHRREILEQAESIFRKVYGQEETETGFIISSKKQFDMPILFATIQTLYREDTLERISRIPF